MAVFWVIISFSDGANRNKIYYGNFFCKKRFHSFAPEMDILNKILGASVELFGQYGFKTITMDDIARRAGISKKTLYQHFANKDEVVKESVLWHKSQMFGQCQLLMDEAETAVEAMVKIMTIIDENLCRINPIALLELQRYYPEGYAEFRDGLLKQDVESVKENLLKGIAEGYYREEMDVDILAKFHIEKSLILLQPNMMVNDRNDIRQVNREIMELFLYGIMTPKGEKLYQKYKEKYLKQVS
ncbi:MAG: hypothetical protein BGO69_02410 [Bacteroidetes bacterium 46-16]|nr:MAG: hypothetical protein BGO69_02410 [Bacteroidetes bacterium 46-16]